MSAELHERLAETTKIDQTIFDAEKEVEEGAELIPVDVAMDQLNKKYYG